MNGLRERREWKLAFIALRADRLLAIAWWILTGLRGALPAGFAVSMGWLVSALTRSAPAAPPLTAAGAVFLLMQVLPPLHLMVSANLGGKIAAWIYDELTRSCVSPPGMGHLENPDLTSDLTTVRNVDLGLTGPPLSVSMDFIAGGLVEMVAGLVSALVLAAYSWWAPLLLGFAWLATHWLLKESGVWKDRNTEEVRQAQRHAEYSYRLAVDPQAAKEIRLFGLADWVVERLRSRRTLLVDLQYRATRLRERPVMWSLLLVLGANLLLFWSLTRAALAGSLTVGGLVTFAGAAVGASAIAFGGLSWALDDATASCTAVLRLRSSMEKAGALPQTGALKPGAGAHTISFRNLSFHYPAASTTAGSPDKAGAAAVLQQFELTIPAGSSLAIVGRNGAGKTTLAKLICRLYDPAQGAIEIDGIDLRSLDLEAWRSRITAVFQDYIRFELTLRENVAPAGAPEEVILSALEEAGAGGLADLDTILARGHLGGIDLSGGQWQRIALARALCAVKLGAGVVLLDEPTAQLDVRGEAEIFDRILAATRSTTTILISHRFSTVRHADRICVLQDGRVLELGSHDELMAAGGAYAAMFQLQASRFEEETDLDSLAPPAEPVESGAAQ